MSKRKGRFINEGEAQAEIEKFRLVQVAASAKIASALSGEADFVKKYYSGNVESFIFERSLIEALFTLTKDKNANAIRVYYAATSSDDGIVKEGAATVILIPAKITYATDGEITLVENVPYSEELTGIQYPGITSIDPTKPHPPIKSDPTKPIAVFDV